MKSKVIIFNEWPPTLRVTGDRIMILLELDTTDTVKKRLSEWGIDYSIGYVLTEDIIEHIKGYNKHAISTSYTGLGDKSKSI